MPKSKEPIVGVPSAVSRATPRSVEIASRGIDTAPKAANFLSAAVADVMAELVPVRTANAAFNGIGKLLKVVEMQHRYAGGSGDGTSPPLRLADPPEACSMAARRKELLRQLAEIDGAAGG